MIKLKGIEVLNKKLIVAAKKAEKLSMQGMIRAAILIRNQTEKVSPITPLDTSNLRHSFFIVTANKNVTNGKFKGKDSGEMTAQHSAVVTQAKGMAVSTSMPALIMGYSARYAAAVHEGKAKGGGQMKFQRPGSGAKWFEIAIDRNKKTIIALMGSELKKI